MEPCRRVKNGLRKEDVWTLVDAHRAALLNWCSVNGCRVNGCRVNGCRIKGCRSGKTALGQDRAGLAAIEGDLCLQSVKAVKLLIRPDEVDQAHAQGLAGDIVGEVEEVDLQAQILAGPRPAESGRAAGRGRGVQD